MVGLGQASLGRGSWDVAWLLTLQEEPPSQLFQRRASGLAAQSFAPLARQQWVTTSLAFLRELDILQTRRAEMRRGGRPWNGWRGQRQTPGDQGNQEVDAAAKAKGKGKKGKEKNE